MDLPGRDLGRLKPRGALTEDTQCRRTLFSILGSPIYPTVATGVSSRIVSGAPSNRLNLLRNCNSIRVWIAIRLGPALRTYLWFSYSEVFIARCIKTYVA